jgi:hypothetical protein
MIIVVSGIVIGLLPKVGDTISLLIALAGSFLAVTVFLHGHSQWTSMQETILMLIGTVCIFFVGKWLGEYLRQSAR